MNIKFLLVSSVVCLNCAILFAQQQSISGKVFNSSNRQPIPYANVGITSRNAGTISNTDGSFLLPLSATYFQDTLVISSIGFGIKRIPVSYFFNRHSVTVYLNEKVTELSPVVIRSKKEAAKTFVAGNADFKGGVLQTYTTYAGRCIALLIDSSAINSKGKLFPAFIENARLRIFRNNLTSFKYRLRLNEVNSGTGYPGKDLLDNSIIMESSMKNGWLEFDLSGLNIEIDHPFFITFEQLLDLKDRTLIADGYAKFLAEHPDKVKVDTVEVNGIKEARKIFTGKAIDLAGTFIGIAVSNSATERFSCYVRETSLGDWKKVRGIVAATVTLSAYPDLHSIPKNDCAENSATCKARKVCDDFMDQSGVNGMQLAVSKAGKTIFSQSFGYADIINKVPVTDSTKFRINSISKSLTSLAMSKLVSQGKLNLDSPIQRYIPEFPRKVYSFTTRQLAGHLAGFRDYDEANPNDYIRTTHYSNAIEALTVFQNDSLLFQPGTQFHYSTFGWNLIGAIIEKISRTDYLTYMKENIWAPLHLQNTCGDNIKLDIANRSKFYDMTGEENDLGDLSYKYPGGGLLSTCNDLIKIGNEILYGSYIDPKLKPLLFQSQHTADNKDTGYGLGWYISKDKNGHRIWYHAGDSFSGSSWLVIYPDDAIVIAFLANSQAGTNFDIEKAGELFY